MPNADCHLVLNPQDGQNCYVYTLSELNPSTGQRDDQGSIYGAYARFLNGWNASLDPSGKDFTSLIQNVDNAPDGSAGLREMRRVRPALVLTDLVMPGLDGIGLLESMREDPALAAIPVVALSAAIWADRVSPSVEFIAKPFSIEKLLEIVGRHVR